MVKRIIKVCLSVALSLLLLLILVFLLLPSAGHVTRSDLIPARPAVVFAQLNNLKTYISWNPWFIGGRETGAAFSHPASGTGAGYTWQNIHGTGARGQYVITESRPDSLLAYRLTLGERPPLEGLFELEPADSGRATHIRWTTVLQAGWNPWWRFQAALMDRLMGPGMEKGLVNLEIVSKQYDRLADIPVREDALPEQYVATISDTCGKQKIFSLLKTSLEDILRFMALKQVKAAGYPMAQFHELPDGRYRVNTGVPLTHEVAPEGRTAVLRRPACKVVIASYEGSYGDIGRVYEVLSKYKALHTQNSPVPAWEAYPDKLPQSDTTVCKVVVYWPVY